MKQEKEIKTTGQLREVLATAIKAVINGEMPVNDAITVHKLAKNISESLYSETKIAMFRSETGGAVEAFGELALGDPNDDIE